MRLLHSTRQTLLALGSATLLLVAPAAPIHAQPGPDPLTIAQAYGELSVFILNVAAGNDGQSRNPGAENAFANAFAYQVLSAYPGWSAKQRQVAAEWPRMRDQVQQLWPTLSAYERRQFQQRWADLVEGRLSNASCDVYYDLARAYLMPADDYWQANNARSVQCWNEYWHTPTVAPTDSGMSQASNDFVPSGLNAAGHVELHGGTLILQALGPRRLAIVVTGTGGPPRA